MVFPSPPKPVPAPLHPPRVIAQQGEQLGAHFTLSAGPGLLEALWRLLGRNSLLVCKLAKYQIKACSI